MCVNHFLVRMGTANTWIAPKTPIATESCCHGRKYPMMHTSKHASDEAELSSQHQMQQVAGHEQAQQEIDAKNCCAKV